MVILDDAARFIIDYMPTVQRLRRLGTTFPNAVAETPVCMSFRCNLFYGQSSARTQIINYDGADVTTAINANRWSWDEHFSSWLPYSSMFVGKYTNHPGPLNEAAANWDKFVEPEDRQAPFITSVNYDGAGYTALTPKTWYAEFHRDEILSFISEQVAPWLVYWGVPAPHYPHGVPPNCHGSYFNLPVVKYEQNGQWPSWILDRDNIDELDGGWDEALRIRRAMIREAKNLDSYLADVLSTWDINETLVVVTSDNGSHLGDHRILGSASKNSPYEEAWRVPFVIAGPGIPHGRTIDVTISPLDLIAGLSDGIETPHVVDGINLFDIIASPEDFAGRYHLGRVTNGEESTRPCADWVGNESRKLIRYYAGASGPDPVALNEVYAMYDLDTDPLELINVAYDSERLAERDSLEEILDAKLALTDLVP